MKYLYLHMKTIILSLIYFVIGILYIALGDQSPFLIRLAIKALIIPVLMIIFLINFRHNLTKLNALILSGLLFSWAGDVIIDFSFILGLVSFLLAQIMYLSAFFLTPGKNVIFSNRFYLLIPVILFGIILIYFLYDDLADMKIPVIIYAIVILTMLAAAINRLEKVSIFSYYLVLAGAILFVISDSAIAVNKFSWHFKHSGPIIMSTYLAAQYLIVMGCIRQFRNKAA